MDAVSLRQTARVIAHSSSLSVRNTFAAVPWWLWLAQVLLTSFFAMAFFAYVADFAQNPEVTVAYVVLGNAIQAVAMVTLYSVANLPAIEKHVGTMPVLISSPTGLFTIFVGMSLFQIMAGFLTVAVSMGYAVYLFGLDLSAMHLSVMVVVIVLTSFSMAGLGMMIGAIGTYLRTGMIIASVVSYIGLVLCGVNFPVHYLPDWLQPISYGLPLTYAVEAARLTAEGATLTEVFPQLRMMLLLGVGMLVASYFMLKGFERMVRRKGAYEAF